MPSKPKSPMGEMAAYYLAMQPHLFQEAVQRAFAQLREHLATTDEFCRRLSKPRVITLHEEVLS